MRSYFRGIQTIGRSNDENIAKTFRLEMTEQKVINHTCTIGDVA